MITIIEKSYQDLNEQGQQAWTVDGKFYTSPELVLDTFQNLIEEAPYFLIWDFMDVPDDFDKTQHPGDIIFPQQLKQYLPKKSFMSFGERVKSLYFTNKAYNKAVIRVEYVFHRDEAKLKLLKIVQTIAWKLSDGTWSPAVKVMEIPVTDPNEQSRELKRRRGNIIDQLKGLAVSMDIGDYVLQLFERFLLEESLYVQAGSQALYKAIRDDEDLDWLNANLPNGFPARATLLSYLSIGLAKGIPSDED